jgi:hypothetical protein
MKAKLLNRIFERVYDKHAHARACVLSVLAELCNDNVIPMEFLQKVLQLAADRVVIFKINH